MVFSTPKEDWEFNVLDIYNFNRQGKLSKYFEFIEKNHNNLDGDICEVGVYRGHSIIATGLFLRQIGSSKKIYGFDSFSGFPAYHDYDDLAFFDSLHQQGIIDSIHLEKVKLNLKYKSLFSSVESTPSNISSSGDFSSTSKELLEKKIDFFNLENIVLIDGSYSETMIIENSNERKFMAVLMDCDLYESHKIALEYTWKNLVKGGYMYLDEYYSLKFPGARYAIHNFFLSRSQKPLMHEKIEGDFERWFVKK